MVSVIHTPRRGRHAVGATLVAALVATLPPSVATAMAQESEATAEAPARQPDVVFVPTPMEAVNAMLAVTRVGKTDVVYDLGCGDGRIVITAASRRGARGVGIDIDPQRIAESRENADSAGVTERVTFEQADLFETDLRPASVITLYLLPTLNEKLRPKLFAELRPGTRIVSHDFNMGDWEPDSTFQVSSAARGASTIYYWLLPAKAAGTWSVAAGDDAYELRLEQKYQRLTGTATNGKRTLQVINGRLTGDKIFFAFTEKGAESKGLQFQGRVDGGKMTGTVAAGRNKKEEWQASRKGA